MLNLTRLNIFFMEPGGETDLNKYFRKILYSIFFGLLWLIAGITAGIYYDLARFSGKPLIYTILFYVCMVITLVWLIRYYIRLWK